MNKIDICLKDNEAISIVRGAIDYLSSFDKDLDNLLNKVTDKACVSNKVLSGVKFPLTLLIEANIAREKLDKNHAAFNTSFLLDLLHSYYLDSGFNYFDTPHIPTDLDCASSITRLLYRDYPGVRQEYDTLIDRNRLKNGLVPTWLDTSEHERWCSGKHPFHMDVLLNYWITENRLRKKLPLDIIQSTVIKYGLSNYWYLPPLYTTFLYCRLLVETGLINDTAFVKPLLDSVNRWDADRKQFVDQSTSCQLQKVKQLIESDGPFDSWYRYVIHMCISNSNIVCDIPTNYYLNSEHFLNMSNWSQPYYWSLGFAPFSNLPIMASLILISGELLYY